MEAARARENFMVIEVLLSVGCLEEVGLIVLLTECVVVMNETDGKRKTLHSYIPFSTATVHALHQHQLRPKILGPCQKHRQSVL